MNGNKDAIIVRILEPSGFRSIVTRSGRTKKFQMKVLDLKSNKIIKLSSFLKTSIDKVVEGHVYKIMYAQVSEEYGVELKPTTVIMEMVQTIPPESQMIVNTFNHPPEKSLAMFGAADLYARRTLSEVTYINTGNTSSTSTYEVKEIHIQAGDIDGKVALWNDQSKLQLPPPFSLIKISHVEMNNLASYRFSSTSRTTIEILSLPGRITAKGYTTSVNFDDELLEIDEELYRCNASILSNMFPQKTFTKRKVEAIVQNGEIVSYNPVEEVEVLVHEHHD